MTLLLHTATIAALVIPATASAQTTAVGVSVLSDGKTGELLRLSPAPR